jgi:hypothetical protein
MNLLRTEHSVCVRSSSRTFQTPFSPLGATEYEYNGPLRMIQGLRALNIYLSRG